jgi:hypothetical protein
MCILMYSEWIRKKGILGPKMKGKQECKEENRYSLAFTLEVSAKCW